MLIRRILENIWKHLWWSQNGSFSFVLGPTRPPAKSKSTEKNIWKIHMFCAVDFDLAGGGLKPKKSKKKKYRGLSYSNREGTAKNWKLWFFPMKSRVEKKRSQIYTFGRSASAILTIYNQIFFSRGPSALIFRDLSFLIWFNGICWRKSAFLHEKLQKKWRKNWKKLTKK